MKIVIKKKSNTMQISSSVRRLKHHSSRSVGGSPSDFHRRLGDLLSDVAWPGRIPSSLCTHWCSSTYRYVCLQLQLYRLRSTSVFFFSVMVILSRLFDCTRCCYWFIGGAPSYPRNPVDLGFQASGGAAKKAVTD